MRLLAGSATLPNSIWAQRRKSLAQANARFFLDCKAQNFTNLCLSDAPMERCLNAQCAVRVVGRVAECQHCRGANSSRIFNAIFLQFACNLASLHGLVG